MLELVRLKIHIDYEPGTDISNPHGLTGTWGGWSVTLKDCLGLPMNVVLSLYLANSRLACSTSLRTNRIFLNAHQGFSMGEEDKRLHLFLAPPQEFKGECS